MSFTIVYPTLEAYINGTYDTSKVPLSGFTQDGGVLVGTGAGAFQEETGATLRASIGAAGNDTEIIFNDGGVPAGDSNFTWKKALNNLVISSSPAPPAPGTSTFHQLHESDSPAHALWAFTSSYAPFIKFYKGNGSVASPTAILNGEILGRIRAYGYDGAAWDSASQAVIQFVATGNFSSGDTPTRLDFYTTPDGSGTAALHLSVDENGLDLLERSTDAATPGTGRWRIYPKSGGIYIVDDAGAVTGPLSTNYIVITGNVSQANMEELADGSVTTLHKHTRFMPWGTYQNLSPMTGASFPFLVTVDRTITFVKLEISAFVLTTNDASNYWNIQLRKASGTQIKLFTTAAQSPTVWNNLTTGTFDVATAGAADYNLQIYCTIGAGSPGALYLAPPILEVSD